MNFWILLHETLFYHTFFSQLELIDNIFTDVILPDSLSGNLIATISDHLPQFLIVHTYSLTLLSTSPIFMRETGLTLIKTILFFIIFHQLEWHTENWSTKYCTETFLNDINELLDNFAPFKEISKYKLKFKLKPWITSGL